MGTALGEVSGPNPSTGTWRYMHHDAHGSPRLVYNDSDELRATVEYTPYGRVLRSAGGMAYFGYTGKIQSGYVDTIHFPLRQYDPELCRWTQRDPLGMADGPNMQGYVGGNPSSYFDPTGGFVLSVAAIAGAVFGGAAVGAVAGALGGYFCAAAGGQTQGRAALTAVVGGITGATAGAATAAALVGGGITAAGVATAAGVGALMGGASNMAIGAMSRSKTSGGNLAQDALLGSINGMHSGVVPPANRVGGSVFNSLLGCLGGS